MRTSVIDSTDIGDRAKAIADERLRNITQCVCARPDGGGALDSSQCEVHREKEPKGLLCETRAALLEHRSTDDWDDEALREEWRRALGLALRIAPISPPRLLPAEHFDVEWTITGPKTDPDLLRALKSAVIR
jgi:hypothetical protein